MKSLSEYLTEALGQKKLDSEQLFFLYCDQIDVKAFAINNKLDEKDAQHIYDVLHSGDIVIVSEEQMKAKYSKDEVKNLMDKIDDLVAAGVRYGTQLGLSPEEKKQREEAEKNLAKEKGEEPKKSKVDDLDFVNQCNTDFAGVDPKNVSEFFWKKSGGTGYLYFIINLTEDIEELIEQI